MKDEEHTQKTLAIDTVFSKLKRLTDDIRDRLPSVGPNRTFARLKLPGFEWPTLRIGKKTARIPVIQGGMGVGISLAGLASAVANAGGVGVIAANAIGMIDRDYYRDGRAANLRALKQEIRKARSATSGLVGVNIMVAVNDFQDLLDLAIDEQVDIVIMGAGLPVKGIPVARMRENGVAAAPIVSSARAAGLIFRMWKKAYGDVPDLVVYEGPKAGGHLGVTVDQIDDPAVQIESVIPGIVETLEPYEREFGRRIPVVAAGGIFTGEDVHAALRLGAAGVQMGTRFVATTECDASDEFKQAYIDCTEDEIGLIKSPVGLPGRAIRNEFLRKAQAGTGPPFRCAWKCLASCDADEANYCISTALNSARQGKMERGFVFAGTNAHRIHEIVPVRSLVDQLSREYTASARNGIAGRLMSGISAIQKLMREHDGLGSRVREISDAYHTALRQKLADAWAIVRPFAGDEGR